jgi:hypothetical protein
MNLGDATKRRLLVPGTYLVPKWYLYQVSLNNFALRSLFRISTSIQVPGTYLVPIAWNVTVAIVVGRAKK